MANINLEKSNKLLSLTLNVVTFVFLLLPLMLYAYFNYGAESYGKTDNYYKITTTVGDESASKTEPSSRPITNLETTKEWLKMSFINLMTYDAANYKSEERYEMVKSIMADEVIDSFWNGEIARIEADIGNGYLRNAAIVSFKPVLLGQAVNMDGKNMWKFYLEVEIKQESKFDSYPRYYKKYIQVVIKEIDPSESFKGIGIVKINIK